MYKKLLLLTALVLLLSGCSNGQSENDLSPSQTDSSSAQENVIQNEPTSFQDKTEVQQAYEDMLNATEFLSITNGGYTFKEYPISSESVVKTSDGLAVNQGAMYEEIGAAIDLYCELGLAQVLDNAFFSVLFGTDSKPEDWEQKLEGLYGFISADGTEEDILSEFELLSTVKGTFDYEKSFYSFEISDLSGTAAELNISENMLGYILAKLNEYPSEISFDGNVAKIVIEVTSFG